MRYGVVLPIWQLSLGDAERLARRADELGFDGVFVHEVGRDQRPTIELFADEVLPALAGAAAAAPAGRAGR
ncbi:MAG TPA: hypothetical protein VJ931_07015 [Actinomycetota bacterium]|nr:hypothetical protein [Actinomycetota bacterium]